MRSIKEVSSLSDVRTALRKHTIGQYLKTQVECGARHIDELLTYVGFMSEDECMAFLNSVREAPFIPHINAMWTQQLTEYLMIGGALNWAEIRGRSVKEFINEFTDVYSYSTDYVKSHVGKEYWDLLPTSWSAKYYSPKQVLKIARRICSEEGLKVNTHKVTPEFLESVKARLAVFGGTDTQKALAKELGVSLSTVNNYAKRIRANMAEAT